MTFPSILPIVRISLRRGASTSFSGGEEELSGWSGGKSDGSGSEKEDRFSAPRMVEALALARTTGRALLIDWRRKIDDRRIIAFDIMVFPGFRSVCSVKN
jgi:hypothetical protein